MKTTETLRDVTSTLQGETVAMGIDEAAMAHIMTVLTDLYSDQELAVIREYSTNAFDAHVDAGVDRPIEVALPTPLSPFFKVRDFGLGLDAEDIRTIYSRYGTSTKRDSDDVVGMLGLGCKSALTYTDQFTLSSVKNGVCTQVSISRDENGAGTMTIVAQYETTDPSGTEVIVPTRSNNEFASKAEEFYKYWAEGTVLVDGEEPKRIDGLWVSEDICLVEKSDQLLTVVMGNVAYPAPYEYNHNNYSVVAFVPIGSVNFTPSRESLQMTKRTKETIEQVKERVSKLKETVAQQRVDEAPSKPQAIREMLKARSLLGVTVKTYKGKEIPKEFSRDRQKASAYRTIRGEKKFREADKGNRQYNLPIALAANAVFFTGYETMTDFTPTRRKKLDIFWQQRQEKNENFEIPETVVLLDNLDLAQWIDKSRVFKWETVNDIKLPREAKSGTTQSGRPTGSYEGYVGGNYATLLAADIDTTKPVFYSLHKEDYEALRLVRAHEKDATVVVLTQNRVNKFKRDFPEAKFVRDYAKEMAEAWAQKLTEDQRIRLVLHNDHSLQRLCASLDPKRVEDPHLRKTIHLAKNKARNRAFIADADLLRRWTAIPTPNHGWEHPEEKYTLLTHVHVYGRMDEVTEEHMYVYLNAAYAAGKGQ